MSLRVSRAVLACSALLGVLVSSLGSPASATSAPSVASQAMGRETMIDARAAIAISSSPVRARTGQLPAEEVRASSGCARVFFIGLRGSGQPARPEQYNMGDTVYRTFEEFAPRAKYAGIDVIPIGIDAANYPAANVETLFEQGAITGQYASVLQGQAGLENQITDIIARRDDSCMVLVGYSQGAWVIGNVLDTLVGLQRTKLLAAVVLYGDPRFDSTASKVVQGATDSNGVVRSGAFAGLGRTDDPYFGGLEDRTRSFCQQGDPVCNFKGVPDASAKCAGDAFLYARCPHLWYVPGPTPGYTGPGADFLFDRVTESAVSSQTPQPPKIDHMETYLDGPLVYLKIFFTDPSRTAEGFGFRGAKGAGWAEENHPFSSPSYGRVGPGWVEYPFNHGCGTGHEIETDVEVWIYDSTGKQSEPVDAHLTCTTQGK